jgi:DNA primase
MKARSSAQEELAAAARRREAKREALRLLSSPTFFNEFLAAIEKAGLVGEQKNALVLFIVIISRLLRRPLNALIKGVSSSGKNWLVKLLLLFVPRDCVLEISSASLRALNYSGDDLRHCVIYLQEHNEAAGGIHPMRLLISEGKLIRIVSAWVDGELVTKRYVARGPVASISTTTKQGLEIDDETRHLSLWLDQGPRQTRQIIKRYTQAGNGLSKSERRAWRMVQRVIAQRVGVRISFPAWFNKVADGTFVEDVSVRRYYPAFIEACRSVCLIRSFQRESHKQRDPLQVQFADFAIAALIFDDVFVESLHHQKGSGLETRRVVERISADQNGKPVAAKDLAKELGVSTHTAYRRIRAAIKSGAVYRTNAPEKTNRKLFAAAPRPRFIPEPEQLFQTLDEVATPVRFVHPLTGKWVIYTRERRPDRD